MSDLDYEKAFQRLDVEHDFLCSKNVNVPSKYNCGDCKYYYLNPDYCSGRCLKQEIKSWTLYQIDKR